MFRLNYLSLLIASLLICSGCTSVSSPYAVNCDKCSVQPSYPMSSPYAVNCDNCSAQPYYSVMIAQPGISSDFPVSYRVRLPEADSRLNKMVPTETVRSRSVAQ
jgi:ribosomal protein L40E